METVQLETVNASEKTLKETNQVIRSGLERGPVVVNEAVHLHGLGAGLRHGNLMVEGGAGDYLGVLNAGARIEVHGDAGNYLADNMNAGEIIVHGNAGFGAAQYCYGGTVVIRGDAGDFTATMNKGAVILIRGSVGDEVGTYTLGGRLVITGNAGDNLANYLIRGSVYIGGEVQSLGNNAKFAPLEEEDLAFLTTSFTKYAFETDPTHFRKIVAISKKPFYK